MNTGQATSLVRFIRRNVLRPGEGTAPDGQLLDRFIENREEEAFEALLQRHGPMVLGVCGRLLHNPHDAEDAFQATFLVLVRKADAIRPRESVGNWLHGVAWRTALKARAVAARRRRNESQLPVDETTSAAELGPDLKQLIDREVDGLPARYRTAVVLCDLEGKSRAEAARELLVPEGTVSSRLARAHEILKRRLIRRGLPAVALTAALNSAALSAEVPGPLMISTVEAATLVAAGQANGVISASVAALMEGVLHTMFMNKIKTTLLFVLVIGLACLLVSSAALRWLPLSQADEAVKPQEKPMETATGDLKVEIEALQVLYYLKVTPEQLKWLKGVAKETSDETRERKAKTSKEYQEKLEELHAALVDASDEDLIDDIFEKLDDLEEAENPEIDEDVEITDAARKRVPELVRMLKPTQLVGLLAGYEPIEADPLDELLEALPKVRGLAKKDWQEKRDDVAYNVARLLAGIDTDKYDKIEDQVVALLSQARTMSAEDFKTKKEDLEKTARQIVGAIDALDVIRNARDYTLAELLSNPRLLAAVEARLKK